MAMTGLCWSSFIECMKWVSCWRALDEQRVRLYCLNTCYWWSIQFEIVTSPPNALQWWWRVCVDLRFLNVWNGVVLSLDKQTVRLYCCVRARIWHLLFIFDPLCGRTHLTLTCCPNTLQWQCMTTWRWSSLVECMERLSFWPWTNSMYVLLLPVR